MSELSAKQPWEDLNDRYSPSRRKRLKRRRKHREQQQSRAPPLSLDERRSQALLSFDGLRLFGISYSRGHLYRLIKAGKFPRPVKLGENRVAFVRNDIVAWIDALKRAA